VRGERPVWAATHVGRVRTLNEDRCLVGDWCSEGPSASWRGALSAGHGWAVVADGMGGHDAGDVASGVALEAIAKLIRTATSEVDIKLMLDAANQRLFESMYGGEGRPGMGTTIVGAVLTGIEALIFNIGDSRAYSIDRNRLVQRSCDDTPQGATKGRWRRSHALTQSLGGTISRRPLQPHLARVTLSEEVALLLCSDGLTDMLNEEEIAGILGRHPEDPAERLVAAALDAGGEDNVTAIVVGNRLDL
jgi:serine/threonine protein phosphatase PrpC